MVFFLPSFKLISTNLFLWIHRISSSEKKRYKKKKHQLKKEHTSIYTWILEQHIKKTNYLSCIFRSDEINHFLVLRQA